MTILPGAGDGTFTPGLAAASDSVVALAAADMKGDGLEDLVAAEPEGLAVLFSRPGGGWLRAASLPVHLAYQVSIADLDVNGNPDIVALAEGSIWTFMVRAAAPRCRGPPGKYDRVRICGSGFERRRHSRSGSMRSFSAGAPPGASRFSSATIRVSSSSYSGTASYNSVTGPAGGSGSSPGNGSGSGGGWGGCGSGSGLGAGRSACIGSAGGGSG